MNLGRLVTAAVAATLVDAVYGFLVYGTLLMSRFSALPGVYRQEDTAPGYMPVLFSGTFIAMLAATYIYSKGHEGGSNLREGLGFGVPIGMFAAGYASLVNLATLNIPVGHGLVMAGAALVEWILAGVVIASLYKPARAVKTAKAGMMG